MQGSRSFLGLREPENAERGLGKSFALVHHLGKIGKIAYSVCEACIVGVAHGFLHHMDRACWAWVLVRLRVLTR